MTRWTPWWISTDDFATTSRFNLACRPISQQEYLTLPVKLRPYMKHLCKEEYNTLDEALLVKSNKAVEKTKTSYNLLKQNSEDFHKANENIIVKTVKS